MTKPIVVGADGVSFPMDSSRAGPSLSDLAGGPPLGNILPPPVYNQRDRIAISSIRIAAATALRAIILLLRPREGADPSEACVSAARELAKETLETMERI